MFRIALHCRGGEVFLNINSKFILLLSGNVIIIVIEIF